MIPIVMTDNSTTWRSLKYNAGKKLLIRSLRQLSLVYCHFCRCTRKILRLERIELVPVSVLSYNVNFCSGLKCRGENWDILIRAAMNAVLSLCNVWTTLSELRLNMLIQNSFYSTSVSYKITEIF